MAAPVMELSPKRKWQRRGKNHYPAWNCEARNREKKVKTIRF
jgi:hypothetical protein